MTDENSGVGGPSSEVGDLIEIDLNFESMRRFQAEFSPNLSKEGLFIDTGEPLDPGSVVRFRVILPEEFVFLEGTAVVEWRRGAEMVTEGAPGMALRFATLSPQNQELVEQLVQDYQNTGGEPFDLDVRPVMGDYPTDALEGAAPSTDDAARAEGYRLTVRQTGAAVQEEALQALVDASPDGGADDASATDTGESAQGFEILSGPPTSPEGAAEDAESPAVDSSEEREEESRVTPEVTADAPQDTMEPEAETPVEPVPAEEGPPKAATDALQNEKLAEGDAPVEPVEAVGEPPELDWPDEEDEVVGAGIEIDSDAADPEVVEAPGVSAKLDWGDESDASEADAGESVAESVTHDPALPAASDPVILETPSDFDNGPEVMDEVSNDSLGSPAFDVSLPEPDDDEPDTTPVLPDEGHSDVTVPVDDHAEGVGSRRRLWPFFLAAIFLLAIAGGFLRPRVAEWLESRGGEEPRVATVQEAADSVEAPGESEAEVSAPVARTTEAADEAQTDASEGDAPDPSNDVPVGEVEAGEPPTPETESVPEPEPEPEPELEPEPEPMALGAARSIESIEAVPGPRGTTVTIRADGSLKDGVLSVEPLTSPPRLLIRLRGIESSYRPYQIEPGTGEVATIRIGHHAERRPPELWVVLDLVGGGSMVDEIDIRGDVAELVVAKP